MAISAVTKKLFEDDAIRGAKKICTKECMSTAKCGREHVTTFGLEPICPDSKCPLLRFDIERKEETREWWEIPFNERNPSNDELFALCATCPHSSGVHLSDDAENYVVDREKNFLTACIDCVVNSIMEEQAESAAEAAMS